MKRNKFQSPKIYRTEFLLWDTIKSYTRKLTGKEQVSEKTIGDQSHIKEFEYLPIPITNTIDSILLSPANISKSCWIVFETKLTRISRFEYK